MKRLLALRFYYVAYFVALGLYLPFLPRWLEARGVHGAAMGVIAATPAAMGILSPPLFGILSDRLDLRGAILRVVCAGAFVCMGALGVTFALGHPLGFAGIFAAVMAFSFFRSPMLSLADVINLELSGGGAGYARTRLWGSVGFLVAVVAAGRAIDFTSPSALLLAVGAALFVAFLAAFPLPAKAVAPPQPGLERAGALLARADLRFFFGASFLAQIAHSSFDLCFTLHLRDLGASDALVGVAWAIGVLSEVALMAFSTSVFRRLTPPWLLVIAFSGAAARWVLIANVTSIPALLALQPLHALSFALMWIASLAHVKASAPGRCWRRRRALLRVDRGGIRARDAALGRALPPLGRLGHLQRGRVRFGRGRGRRAGVGAEIDRAEQNGAELSEREMTARTP